mgnify:CR=1 FL=1
MLMIRDMQWIILDDDYDDDDDWDDEDWDNDDWMMRMTSSWMIIGRWRVLVPGS